MRRDLTRLGAGARPPWIDEAALANLERLREMPFGDDEYAARLSRVRNEMAARGFGAYLVFRPSSVEYLCGHHTIEPLPQPLVVLPDALYLVIPDAEVGRALVSSNIGHILHYSPFEDGLSRLVSFLSGQLSASSSVALEMRQAATPPITAELLRQAGLRVVDANYLAERLRLVLSPAEVAHVRQAASVTDEALVEGTRAASKGALTDSELAAEIKRTLVRTANSQAAFDVVVATGWRGGVPHSTWSNTAIHTGTTTFLEFSGAHHRYVAPVMRTFSHGAPTSDARRLEGLAQSMLAAVTECLRPGVLCSDVATSAKKALGRLEDDVIFHFNFGYPIGVAHPPSWMDGAPFYLVETNHSPVDEGMVFHLPASFRKFGHGGVGLSQTIYVTKNGVEVITTSAPELQVV
jgi:Xaa-Pro dipeptidase